MGRFIAHLCLSENECLRPGVGHTADATCLDLVFEYAQPLLQGFAGPDGQDKVMRVFLELSSADSESAHLHPDRVLSFLLFGVDSCEQYDELLVSLEDGGVADPAEDSLGGACSDAVSAPVSRGCGDNRTLRCPAVVVFACGCRCARAGAECASNPGLEFAVQYLEHVIARSRDSHPLYHTLLARLYLCKVLALLPEARAGAGAAMTGAASAATRATSTVPPVAVTVSAVGGGVGGGGSAVSTSSSSAVQRAGNRSESLTDGGDGVTTRVSSGPLSSGGGWGIGIWDDDRGRARGRTADSDDESSNASDDSSNDDGDAITGGARGRGLSLRASVVAGRGHGGVAGGATPVAAYA